MSHRANIHAALSGNTPYIYIGSKVGEEEKESINAFDYTQFVSLYKHHGLTPPRQEVIAGFSGAGRKSLLSG